MLIHNESSKKEHYMKEKIKIKGGNNESKCEDNFQFLRDISSNKDNFYFEENRKEINKFFTVIIPDYKKDFFLIITRLSKKVKEEFFSKKNINELYPKMSNQKLIEILREKINHKENVSKQLILDGENLTIIAKILSESFCEISDNSKIKTFSEFLISLDSKNNQTESELNEIYDRLNKDFSKRTKKYQENEYCLFETINRTLINYTFFQKLLTSKINIPNELKELRDLLNSVKSIKIEFSHNELENLSLPVSIYLLVFMNFNWMLKDLIEVKINYSLTYNKTANYYDIQKVNKLDPAIQSTFLKMIIISSFVAKMENIINLILDIPYSFGEEIEKVLQKEKTSVKNFHLLDLFADMKHLCYMELTFNSLDSNTFQRVLLLINNNSKTLKNLKLRLFPALYNTSKEKEKNLLFSKNFLYKLCSVNKIDTSEIKDKYTKKTILSVDFDNLLLKEKDLLINRLINLFEMDIELVFYLLSIKLTNLNTFCFMCEVPREIYADDKFNISLHKFIFNFFAFLSTSFNSLRSFTIDSNVSLNMRKYQYLNKHFENFDFSSNNSLQNLKINLKFQKFSKSVISKLIPAGIESLMLGELDFFSFSEFSQVISINNKQLAKLKYLYVTLSDILYDFNKNIDSLISSIRNSKPDRAEFVNLNLKISLNEKNALKIIQNIPDDHVKVYRIYFINSDKPKSVIDDLRVKEIYSKSVYHNFISMLLFVFSLRMKRKDLFILKNIIDITTKYINVNRGKKLIVKFDEK